MTQEIIYTYSSSQSGLISLKENNIFAFLVFGCFVRDYPQKRWMFGYTGWENKPDPTTTNIPKTNQNTKPKQNPSHDSLDLLNKNPKKSKNLKNKPKMVRNSRKKKQKTNELPTPPPPKKKNETLTQKKQVAQSPL